MNLKTMPKLDLHCHLDGSVRLETLLDLCLEQNLKPFGTSLEEIQVLARVPDLCNSLVDYLKCFDLPLKVMQNKNALKRISTEFIQDCKADGVAYAEIRFAPILHTQMGLFFEEIIEAVIEGLNEGSQTIGVPYGLIICCMRHMSPEDSLATVKKTLPYLNNGVVAMDLAGDEANFPPLLHQKAFDLAKSHGFNITIHAGETGSSQNISDSILELHADRIGHGVAAKKDPSVINLLIDRNVALEMCPTSNVQTKAVPSLDQHPILDYLDLGIPVTLNTDNRTVSNISSTLEFTRVANTFSLNSTHFERLYFNAINAAFTTQTVKDQLKALWK